MMSYPAYSSPILLSTGYELYKGSLIDLIKS